MEVWLDLLRRKPPGEKLAQALQLSGFVLQLSEAGVRSRHPQADDREVFLRMAAQHLSRELMMRVYGWDPETDAHSG